MTFENGGQGYAPRLRLFIHLVGPRPREHHLISGGGHALNREHAHGAVKGEYVQVALTIEHEVASHGEEHCAVVVDAERHLAGVDALVGSVFDNVDVRLPDVGVVGQGIHILSTGVLCSEG